MCMSRVLVDLCVAPGDVVVDIGANTGLFAARFAERVGRAGRVIAYEPNPAHGPVLTRLSARLPQLEVRMVGLSDQSGEMTMRIPLVGDVECHWMATLQPEDIGIAASEQQVPITTLDCDLAAGDVSLAFIKCDVEGHEHHTLLGARATLEHAHPSVLIEVEQRHRADSITDTFRMLEDLGYHGWALHRDKIVPVSEFSVRRDQTAYVESGAVSAHHVPEQYVNEFFFSKADGAHSRALDGLLGRAQAR